MKKSSLSLLTLFTLVYLVGCASANDGDSEIGTEGSLIYTPTSIVDLESEGTFLETPHPTPSDKIILGDGEDFLFQSGDLPYNYMLSLDGVTEITDLEILSTRGIEKARPYMKLTGRIGGWVALYDRVSPTAAAPRWMRTYIVIYENVEGPVIATSPEWDSVLEEEEIFDLKMDLGEWSRVRVIREEREGEEDMLLYAVEFYYRNVWAEVMGIGWESEVQHEYIEKAARVLLGKLEAAPLSEP